MDARAVLHPVGPHEPRVYWTRRAVALGAVLLVVLLLAHACDGGSGTPATRSTTSPSPRPSATVTTAPAAAPVTACRAAQLTVTAGTDAGSYPAGVQPHLRVSIANTSSAPCRLAVTGGAITWAIVSGTDRIWTTADCKHSPTTVHTTVRPGAAYRTTIIWDRHRSTPGCATPGASADPGTYQLLVSTLGVRSAVAVFHLTG